MELPVALPVAPYEEPYDGAFDDVALYEELFDDPAFAEFRPPDPVYGSFSLSQQLPAIEAPADDDDDRNSIVTSRGASPEPEEVDDTSDDDGEEPEEEPEQREERRRQSGRRRPAMVRERRLPEPIVYRDLDLSRLHDPTIGLDRAHPPIPESTFDSRIDCIRFYEAWAKEHGLFFARKRWIRGATGKKYKCEVRCHRGLDRKELDARVRMGAASYKTGCKYEFYIVALNRTDPMAGQWRILHQKGKSGLKSVLHNHPPMENIYVHPRYRREGQSNEVRQAIRDLFPHAKGAKSVLIQLRERFEGLQMTRQDVRNEYRLYQHKGLEFSTTVEVLVEKLEKSYIFRSVFLPSSQSPVSPGQSESQDFGRIPDRLALGQSKAW